MKGRLILLVEDSPTQAERTAFLLEEQGWRVETAGSGGEGMEKALSLLPDLIISDVVMPGMDGFAFCQAVKTTASTRKIPFVLLTGQRTPMDIVHGLEKGADNFIAKPFEDEHLVARVRRIFENLAHREKGGLEMEISVRVAGREIVVNADKQQMIELLFSTSEELSESNKQLEEARLRLEEQARDLERMVEERTRELLAEQHLKAAVLDSVEAGIVACDARGTLTLFNRAAVEFHGLPQEPLPAERWAEHYDLYFADGVTPMGTQDVPLLRALMAEPVDNVEMVIKPKDRPLRKMLVSGRTMVDDQGQTLGAVVAMHDVTEHERLQAQLLQSQKMEAVGQLAGGVAHDFNNLLSVILGYSGLLLKGLEPGQPAYTRIDQIRQAAERGAALTRQLLAFSRKQVLQPRMLDLNAVVAQTETLLRRLIGEDVHLEIVLGDGLGQVKADPGQMEQVIMNLAVNARDAMPGGGTLTIETANVELGEEYAQTHVDVRPGPYVVLRAIDTGTGMDAATMSRIFEPFFTTKEEGKGTGLGLSTVFGIVKQSGGHLSVHSEPGDGATFSVYLPRIEAERAPLPLANGAHRQLPTGTETILLVEDAAPMREMVGEILEEKGYRVLRAATADDAIATARAHEGPIDLLLTDVIMPHKSGRQVAEAVLTLRPRMRVIYMSGYTSGIIEAHGVAETDLHFLQKPFTGEALQRKVREVLEQR
jgi:PAS domain S-box-containing protein